MDADERFMNAMLTRDPKDILEHAIDNISYLAKYEPQPGEQEALNLLWDTHDLIQDIEFQMNLGAELEKTRDAVRVIALYQKAINDGDELDDLQQREADCLITVGLCNRRSGDKVIKFFCHQCSQYVTAGVKEHARLHATGGSLYGQNP